MPIVYEYKQRIGPWGMVARLRAEIAQVEAVPDGARRVGERDVWIRCRGDIRPSDSKWIEYTLSLVARQFPGAAGGSVGTLVTVQDLEIPVETEYQEQAAGMAMMGWLVENAGVVEADVTVDFDKKGDRYVFGWGRKKLADSPEAERALMVEMIHKVRTGAVRPRKMSKLIQQLEQRLCDPRFYDRMLFSDPSVSDEQVLDETLNFNPIEL